MVQPGGFIDEAHPDFVCKLKRSLYGLKQSPRMWNQTIDKFMLELGFKKCEADHCIYVKRDDQDMIFVVKTSSEDVITCSEYEKNVTILLPVLLELCAGMAETQDICEDVLERLQRLQYLVDEQPTNSCVLIDSFQLIISRFHAFLVQHSNQASVGRLASTRTILGLLRTFHCDLDEIVSQIASVEEIPIHCHWEKRWDDTILAVENRLVNAWDSNSSELSNELPDTASQTDALLLLNSEAMRHKSRYSARSQGLLESASKKVARMSGAPIPDIPEWFVPRHEVQREAQPFASGSFGKIYRGVWKDSKVVIKCVTVNTPAQKKAFLREARIWHKARHPHIVNFFGACYDSQPCFFICEEATNGNLADYLDKRKTAERTLVWRKLLEAALGLRFLHQNKIVHGDLKCNQILVGGDEVAKLTDFGLSFVSTGSMPNGSGGAIRWRAPECLGCNGQKPTVESDVYSFGMCVVEAVTYDVPWGVYLADIAVMDHLQRGTFLSRPKPFTNDAEWEFVLALCALDPVKRIKLEDAIKQLQRLAQGLSISPKPMLAMNQTSRSLKKESLEEIQNCEE
ncbi:TKL protein kinase [Phytophthora palmivora]|uniref:TKL protein kinase n=1 Tax=Phytophthora palmivora TaxID=4796 RepID=A0A2P4YBY0_9STRA|nr:TKL protein kinase [Phytophthora palmivora]